MSLFNELQETSLCPGSHPQRPEELPAPHRDTTLQVYSVSFFLQENYSLMGKNEIQAELPLPSLILSIPQAKRSPLFLDGIQKLPSMEIRASRGSSPHIRFFLHISSCNVINILCLTPTCSLFHFTTLGR